MDVFDEIYEQRLIPKDLFDLPDQRTRCMPTGRRLTFQHMLDHPVRLRPNVLRVGVRLVEDVSDFLRIRPL